MSEWWAGFVVVMDGEHGVEYLGIPCRNGRRCQFCYNPASLSHTGLLDSRIMGNLGAQDPMPAASFVVVMDALIDLLTWDGEVGDPMLGQ